MYELSHIKQLTVEAIAYLKPTQAAQVTTSVNEVKSEVYGEYEHIIPITSIHIENLYDAALLYKLPPWFYSQINVQCDKVAKNARKTFRSCSSGTAFPRRAPLIMARRE